MSEFFSFASEHPVLTFFLALIIGDVAIKIVRAGMGCKSCEKKDSGDDD